MQRHRPPRRPDGAREHRNHTDLSPPLQHRTAKNRGRCGDMVGRCRKNRQRAVVKNLRTRCDKKKKIFIFVTCNPF